jgi:hypothetical protein
MRIFLALWDISIWVFLGVMAYVSLTYAVDTWLVPVLKKIWNPVYDALLLEWVKSGEREQEMWQEWREWRERRKSVD